MRLSWIRNLLLFFIACSSACLAYAGPCDVFQSSTPCVAAYSTTRALYSSYAGPLYQVTRASDNAVQNIGLLSDGYANAATQDTFCAGTKCVIGIIYDQTANHNNLTVAPPGGAYAGPGPNGYDIHAVANAFPVTAGGHKVYGVYISPTMGYRNDSTIGVATGSQPEGMYMVTSTTHMNRSCCFDFGNAETSNTDTGAGHMDAVTVRCPAEPCSPIAGIDMENGIYPYNPPGTFPILSATPFLTVMAANDGQSTYALWQGNAKSGGLTTTGPLALPSGYSPMHKEGAIILGIGGDNSDNGMGTFFEGVMTSGAPTSTVMGNVQSNIITVEYQGMLPYHDAFASGSWPGWAMYGGTWGVSGGSLINSSIDTNGDKAITGSPAWDNYTMQGDVQITSSLGDAGLIFRVTNPGVGNGLLDAYYVGVTTGGHLNFLRQQNSSTTVLQQAVLPYTQGQWYHITAQVAGCTFAISAQPVGSTTVTGFTYTDTNCPLTAGYIGVRSYNVAAQWRDINVAVGSSTTLPYYAPFASNSSGWTPYSGSWSVSSEDYVNSASDASDMSVASTTCTACTVNGDVMLTSNTGTAGLLLAASNPGPGTDNVSAYYLAIDSAGQIDMNKEANNSTSLNSVYLNALPANVWYHITASINGCYIRLVAQNVSSEYPNNEFTFQDCSFTSGAIGLQSAGTAAKWRYISVVPNQPQTP